jgi:hypothetical protein
VPGRRAARKAVARRAPSRRRRRGRAVVITSTIRPSVQNGSRASVAPATRAVGPLEPGFKTARRPVRRLQPIDIDDRRRPPAWTATTMRTAPMDTIFDIWLADRRRHRKPRTIVRRRPDADPVAA